MKRELHDLLHNLVDDAERPPEPEVNVSEASRQKVNKIVDEMNRGQQTETLPKPVYDKPPSRKRPPVVTPDPVSHFSDTPSQNPAVRMHDRLLEDALPKPDAERKPVRKTEHKSSKKKHKKEKSAPEASKPKKEFHIEIKEELPPDIPRDTSVADRLKQEKLEAVLAATPPKTPEQIRREKIRKRAAEIKQQMELQAKQKQELPPEQPEPEEIIPAWEDELSEFSEKSETQNSEQLKFLQESETSGVPELSELPEIPQTSGDDTGLMQISEELGAELPAAPKKKKKKEKEEKICQIRNTAGNS